MSLRNEIWRAEAGSKQAANREAEGGAFGVAMEVVYDAVAQGLVLGRRRRWLGTVEG